jgi:hypothetical protein
MPLYRSSLKYDVNGATVVLGGDGLDDRVRNRRAALSLVGVVEAGLVPGAYPPYCRSSVTSLKHDI